MQQQSLCEIRLKDNSTRPSRVIADSALQVDMCNIKGFLIFGNTIHILLELYIGQFSQRYTGQCKQCG